MCSPVRRPAPSWRGPTLWASRSSMRRPSKSYSPNKLPALAAENQGVSSVTQRDETEQDPQEDQDCTAAGAPNQAFRAHGSSLLGLTSSQPMKCATGLNSPATRPSPRKTISQPGHGTGTATLPPSTSKTPRYADYNSSAEPAVAARLAPAVSVLEAGARIALLEPLSALFQPFDHAYLCSRPGTHLTLNV